MSAKASGSAAAPSRTRRLRWLRGLHPALCWVVVVWIAAPEERSRVYRLGVLATYAVLAATLVGSRLAPSLGRRVATALERPLARLDLVLVNLVLLVLLGELVFGALAATTNSPIFAMEDVGAAERIRHQRYRPFAWHSGHRCNELGFVDEPFARERRPGVRRIVALGDSFAVAVVPYPQNYLTLLDEALDTEAPTELLNFGVTGIGPAEYLQLWRAEARHYDPDLVLVAFFVGNDFVEHKRRSLLHPLGLRSFAIPLRLWRALTTAADFGEAGDLGVMPEGSPTFGEEEYLAIERGRARICETAPDAAREARFRQTFALLAELREAIGPRLRVVVIPDEFQVDDALWRAITAGPAPFDRERPNRELAARLESLGIPVLDLLGTMRDAAKVAAVYKPRDGHWNARGNAVAAAAIARWLREDGWR
jgi:lysophospholipase L1-like esterase